jgi:chorismate synthase
LNEDQRSKDYDHNDQVFRPSHADFTYTKKYGIRDHRGGGRSSARETIARVVAGAIARQVLAQYKIEIYAFVSRAGKIQLNLNHSELDLNNIESNPVRCPHASTAEMMYNEIEKARKDGDTVGGVVSAIIKNVPVGWGEPVFDKLHADLAKAMMSINAVKGFEYGGGFSMAEKRGSEVNDEITKTGTTTNFSGGIQGGISNGEEIYFNVAFKPVATIVKSQKTVNDKGEETTIEGKGRHDPCVVPRAVPIVEAMAAMVLLDHCLRAKSNS